MATSFRLRMPPELQRDLTDLAAVYGMSLNNYLVYLLTECRDEAVGGKIVRDALKAIRDARKWKATEEA